MSEQSAVTAGGLPIGGRGADGTAVAPVPVVGLDVEIENLRQGQVVQVTIRGPWTTDGLEARLASLVAVRQPAELHLRFALDARPTLPPALERIQRALAEVGGVLVVAPLTD